VVPEISSSYRDVMKGIVQDLAFQYRLVYSSQNPRDGKFHKVKVEAFRIVNDKRQDLGACASRLAILNARAVRQQAGGRTVPVAIVYPPCQHLNRPQI
jgi:hypothetical protein